jgi:hypothetical protein
VFSILIGNIYAYGPHTLWLEPNEIKPVASCVIVPTLDGLVALVEQALADGRQLCSISRVDRQVQVAGQIVW